MENGIKRFDNGRVEVYKNGQLHCDDGPAVVTEDNKHIYYQFIL